MVAQAPPNRDLIRRLRDGLERIGLVLRADQWAAAGAAGLNPTQAHVLTFIVGRGDSGVRVGAIAAELGVTQPTATDSIAALVRKGLLSKVQHPRDARAAALRATEAGRHVVRGLGLVITSTERALETLNDDEQEELLHILIKTIRALQNAGVIAPQRLCVTCRYFRPRRHDDPRAPHHCDYVDAAFGAQGLRVDCGEHEALDPREQETVWRRYEASAAEGGRTAKIPTQ